MSSSAPAPSHRRGRETAADMVRSLLVVFAVVAAVVLVSQPPDGRIERPVELDRVTQEAAAAGLPVEVPEVPEGWTPNGARFSPDTREGLPTWHVGYVTPEGRYAAVDVTRGATPRWVLGVSNGGEEVGTRDIDGTAWQELAADGDPVRRSLVREQAGTTTVVTGTAPVEQLELLVRAVNG